MICCVTSVVSVGSHVRWSLWCCCSFIKRSKGESCCWLWDFTFFWNSPLWLQDVSIREDIVILHQIHDLPIIWLEIVSRFWIIWRWPSLPGVFVYKKSHLIIFQSIFWQARYYTGHMKICYNSDHSFYINLRVVVVWICAPFISYVDNNQKVQSPWNVYVKI